MGGGERKNVTGKEEGWEIKLRHRRKRQIASALVCHLYDLSVRELVKLNSGVVWCRKSHFPIRAMESHINKLHKYFLHKREGEPSLTVQWNLSKALFMCVTECLRCPPLLSLQVGRTPGLRQLYCCHTTCLSLGFLLWRTCAVSVCMCECLCVTGKCQPVICPHYDQLNHSRVVIFKDAREGGKPRKREKQMTNGHDSEVQTTSDNDSASSCITHPSQIP